ncbi:MAG TPA: ABC transporter permease subunit [Solirubrobacteraceae bacterium]|jgi:putative spermidine/putrescine transport system permease protein|nr:ABC transporter permease subunit [Solirubrobacteraceae bacterium]
MLPFSVYILIFLGLPLYEVIHGAFTTDAGKFTWQNFSTIFSQPQYWTLLKNSVILSAWTALAGAFFGTWLAAAVVAGKPGGMLRRVVSSGSGVLAYFAGVPLAFAFIATLGRAPGGVLTVLLKHIGIDLYAHGFSISSLFGVGLAYVYFQVPMMVILITPALEGLRPQWEEAAQSLGASRLEYLRHVAIPVMAPAFIGSLMILFGNAFSAYATALALVGAALPLVPAGINEAINGNVLVNQDRIALALGVEMIMVVVIIMVGYWLVQRRARRWLQ